VAAPVELILRLRPDRRRRGRRARLTSSMSRPLPPPSPHRPRRGCRARPILSAARCDLSAAGRRRPRPRSAEVSGDRRQQAGRDHARGARSSAAVDRLPSSCGRALSERRNEPHPADRSCGDPAAPARGPAQRDRLGSKCAKRLDPAQGDRCASSARRRRSSMSVDQAGSQRLGRQPLINRGSRGRAQRAGHPG
jgi:hypothetical protein